MNKVTKTWMGEYSSVVEYRILKNQHSRKSQADRNIEVLVLLASFIVLGFFYCTEEETFVINSSV